MRWFDRHRLTAALAVVLIATGYLLASTPAQAAGSTARAVAAEIAAEEAGAEEAGAEEVGALEFSVAATVTKTVFVRAGDWRTLETFVNAAAIGVFNDPAGAQIKVRYGVGIFGFDRQKQTLDGLNDKRLDVGKSASLGRARMQIKVSSDTEVTYRLILEGP